MLNSVGVNPTFIKSFILLTGHRFKNMTSKLLKKSSEKIEYPLKNLSPGTSVWKTRLSIGMFVFS